MYIKVAIVYYNAGKIWKHIFTSRSYSKRTKWREGLSKKLSFVFDFAESISEFFMLFSYITFAAMIYKAEILKIKYMKYSHGWKNKFARPFFAFRENFAAQYNMYVMGPSRGYVWQTGRD